jgi:hypothetical protein
MSANQKRKNAPGLGKAGSVQGDGARAIRTSPTTLAGSVCVSLDIAGAAPADKESSGLPQAAQGYLRFRTV